ncbi:MAG: metallophosphoesterase [Armatimonadota bacterium]
MIGDARRPTVVAALLLALLLAVPVLAEDFWFAAASDTHIRDEASTQIVRDAIAMIDADRRIALSLWLGDITDRSMRAEFELAKATLSLSRKAWHPLRGNHDLKDGLYEEFFGPLNYVFEHEGWTFIMLDSNLGGEMIIDQTRMEWLRERIMAIDPDTPIVLCCHHPLILAGVVPVAGAPEILQLFAGHNLRAVLAGHLHLDQEHTINGVLHTVTNCLATTRGNADRDPRRGYRLFHCQDGRITTQFVTVREIAEQ